MVSIPSWVPYLGSEKEEKLPLREFIYLDEVSVISLLASLTREITESRTDKATTERKKTWRFRLLKWIPWVGASRETHRISRDSEEVNRKSEIQSKFDELYSKTSDNFELSVNENNIEKPISELERGGIMELHVDFSAHELFHFYKAYQYLFDVFEAHTEDFSQEEEEIIELMGSLFGEQIPVVGEVINYRIVDDEIRSADDLNDDQGEKLQIAGTLDPDMLWQEPSQFLYDENQFLIYARIPEPKLQDDWDPVKLTRVIKSINEPIGNKLRQIIEFGLTQAKQELDEADFDPESKDSNKLGPLPTEYFDHIENEYLEAGISSEQRRELLENAYAASITGEDSSEVEIGAEVLKNVTDELVKKRNADLDRNELSDYRIDLVNGEEAEIEVEQSEDSDDKYLEVSFVAVYW